LPAFRRAECKLDVARQFHRFPLCHRQSTTTSSHHPYHERVECEHYEVIVKWLPKVGWQTSKRTTHAPFFWQRPAHTPLPQSIIPRLRVALMNSRAGVAMEMFSDA
jgi:hypothetical protein